MRSIVLLAGFACALGRLEAQGPASPQLFPFVLPGADAPVVVEFAAGRSPRERATNAASRLHLGAGNGAFMASLRNGSIARLANDRVMVLRRDSSGATSIAIREFELRDGTWTLVRGARVRNVVAAAGQVRGRPQELTPVQSILSGLQLLSWNADNRTARIVFSASHSATSHALSVADPAHNYSCIPQVWVAEVPLHPLDRDRGFPAGGQEWRRNTTCVAKRIAAGSRPVLLRHDTQTYLVTNIGRYYSSIPLVRNGNQLRLHRLVKGDWVVESLPKLLVPKEYSVNLTERGEFLIAAVKYDGNGKWSTFEARLGFGQGATWNVSENEVMGVLPAPARAVAWQVDRWSMPIPWVMSPAGDTVRLR